MKLTIKKSIESPSVRKVADRFHFKRDEMWHLYFDTGIEYLANLRTRVRRKRDFDWQFGPLMEMYGKLPIKDVFDMIQASEHFWLWWGTRLWSVCHELEVSDKTELEYRLIFTADFIPLFILRKIFDGSKKHCRSTRAQREPEPAL